MNTEKFTPGKWFFEGENEVNTEQKNICRCIRLGMEAEEMKANAALIAAAPEMYSNEEKNLEILKIVQDVYTELKYLIEHDSDEKTCLPSLPEDTFDFILKRIKIRIIKTEKALKKARGEE